MGTVSGGEAAGIAIGCLIMGVLICGLAVYLLGRKRNLQQQKKQEGDNVEEEISIGEKARPAQGIVGGSAILVTAPQPVHTRTGSSSTTSRSSTTTSTASLGNDDEEIKEAFHRLNIAIRGHAELYYHTTPILEDDKTKFCDANLPTLDEILGQNAPLDSPAMDALLQTSETRHDAIRLLIAWSIFKYIQPTAPIERTLLPPEMVKCAQAMSRAASIAVVEQARHSVPRKPLPGSKPVTAEDDHRAFAKWRETSGKLLEPIYGVDGSVMKSDDSREHNIGELVTILVCLLQPYVAKGYGGARVRDLENIIKKGAAFGYRLFIQRREWEFAWSTLMSDELVVYPALVKIGDDKGRKLRKSVVLDWEETVKLPEGESVEEIGNRLVVQRAGIAP